MIVINVNPQDAYGRRNLEAWASRDETAVLQIPDELEFSEDETDSADKLMEDLMFHLTRPVDPEFYAVVQYDAWVQVAAAGNILGSDYIREEQFADRSEAYAFAQSLGPNWVVIRDDDPTRMRNGS